MNDTFNSYSTLAATAPQGPETVEFHKGQYVFKDIIEDMPEVHSATFTVSVEEMDDGTYEVEALECVAIVPDDSEGQVVRYEWFAKALEVFQEKLSDPESSYHKIIGEAVA